MNWKKADLKSFAQVKNGFAFKSNEYTSNGLRVIRITNVQKGKIVDSNPQFVDKSRKKEFENYSLYSGDILISLTGNVGRVGILTIDLEPAVLNQRVACIRVNNKDAVNSKYLFQYLNSDLFEKDCINNSNGIAQLNLSSKWVEGHQIPLPPLDDQMRIATILTRAEELIAKRKESIKTLDELLKSTFLEMFGDPVRNEKGWEKQSLKDCMLVAPQNGLYKHQSLYGSGTKIIRIDSFYDGFVQNIANLKLVDILDDEIEKYSVRENDILINRVNSIEYLGKIGVVPKITEAIVYESNMMRFRLNENMLLPIYLMFLFRLEFIKSQIRSKTKNAVNQASINQKDVNSFIVPCPSIGTQKQFASIVWKVESLKVKYTQSLVELENLYGSLSQLAFKGELDLSKVPVGCDDEQIRITITGSDNVELKQEVEFTRNDLVELTKKHSGEIISFDEIWKEIEMLTSKSTPDRKYIQKQILEMLESKTTSIQQVFDYQTSQANNQYKEKQIAFRIENEN